MWELQLTNVNTATRRHQIHPVAFVFLHAHRLCAGIRGWARLGIFGQADLNLLIDILVLPKRERWASTLKGAARGSTGNIELMQTWYGTAVREKQRGTRNTPYWRVGLELTRDCAIQTNGTAHVCQRIATEPSFTYPKRVLHVISDHSLRPAIRWGRNFLTRILRVKR